MEPFERGEIDRASLDATERLRQRLSSQRPAPAPGPSRNVVPWVFAGGLFVFAAGMIANPVFEATVRTRLPFAAELVQTASADEVAALRARLGQLERRAGPAGAPAPVERLARTEAKIDSSTDLIAREAERLDKLTADLAALSTQVEAERARDLAATATVTAAADRAEGMLALVLARRAIESGRPLGPLEPVLRRAFEARYPEAVRDVTALGATPVTLATLQRDLAALRPALGGRAPVPARLSWWDALKLKAGGLVGTTAPEVEGPLDRATAALTRGDVAGAALLVRRLPPERRGGANGWLTAADRLVAGQQGLATLENAALLSGPAPAVPAPIVAAPAR